MPHDFVEYEQEPDAQSSSARGGGPPGKFTSAGVLDPLVPPKRPPGSIPALGWPLWLRVGAMVVLAGIVAAIVFVIFHIR